MISDVSLYFLLMYWFYITQDIVGTLSYSWTSRTFPENYLFLPKLPCLKQMALLDLCMLYYPCEYPAFALMALRTFPGCFHEWCTNLLNNITLSNKCITVEYDYWNRSIKDHERKIFPPFPNKYRNVFWTDTNDMNTLYSFWKRCNTKINVLLICDLKQWQKIHYNIYHNYWVLFTVHLQW